MEERQGQAGPVTSTGCQGLAGPSQRCVCSATSWTSVHNALKQGWETGARRNVSPFTHTLMHWHAYARVP